MLARIDASSNSVRCDTEIPQRPWNAGKRPTPDDAGEQTGSSRQQSPTHLVLEDRAMPCLNCLIACADARGSDPETRTNSTRFSISFFSSSAMGAVSWRL
jgi:hypothetical protein